MLRTALIAIIVTSSTVTGASPEIDGHHITEQGSPRGAPPCTSCHGARLQGNEAIKAPALAGKSAAYIVARLDHYASPDSHAAKSGASARMARRFTDEA
jgi:cytochrome c553